MELLRNVPLDRLKQQVDPIYSEDFLNMSGQPLTYADSLDAVPQLVFPQQVLYRYACIKITYVHQYGGCVNFSVDCLILITC